MDLNLHESVSGKLISFRDGKEIKPQFSHPRFNGPVSGKMWETVSGLGSKYDDTFDWTVYDRIYNRFGENQPRGGVVFKTTLKLVNFHPQCSKCHYSLELDTYGRGCTHNCEFCYAKDQLTLKGYWNKPYPMPVDLSDIRKIFFTVFETDKNSKWRDILSKRIPIRIGSMSDSFMWMDKKFGVTRELLRILRFYNYPYIIFTRSDLVAEDSYLAELDRKLCSVQFSMSGDNEELTRKLEPGAPGVSRRLDALKKLNSAGIWTTVRINPLFAKYPDGYFTDKEEMVRFNGNIPTLDLLNIDNLGPFFDRLKDSNVPSVLAGFVRLNQNSIHRMSKILNQDLRQYYKPKLFRARGENGYSSEEIGHYYRVIQKEASKHNIRFNSCYIGYDPSHYFKFQNLWSNKGDCCDAVGNVSAFKNTSQQIPWDVRLKHSNNRELATLAQKKEMAAEKETAGNGEQVSNDVRTGLTYFGKVKEWREETVSQE